MKPLAMTEAMSIETSDLGWEETKVTVVSSSLDCETYYIDAAQSVLLCILNSTILQFF